MKIQFLIPEFVKYLSKVRLICLFFVHYYALINCCNLVQKIYWKTTKIDQKIIGVVLLRDKQVMVDSSFHQEGGWPEYILRASLFFLFHSVSLWRANSVRPKWGCTKHPPRRFRSETQTRPPWRAAAWGLHTQRPDGWHKNIPESAADDRRASQQVRWGFAQQISAIKPV